MLALHVVDPDLIPEHCQVWLQKQKYKIKCNCGMEIKLNCEHMPSELVANLIPDNTRAAESLLN